MLISVLCHIFADSFLWIVTRKLIVTLFLLLPLVLEPIHLIIIMRMWHKTQIIRTMYNVQQPWILFAALLTLATDWTRECCQAKNLCAISHVAGNAAACSHVHLVFENGHLMHYISARMISSFYLRFLVICCTLATIGIFFFTANSIY